MPARCRAQNRGEDRGTVPRRVCLTGCGKRFSLGSVDSSNVLRKSWGRSAEEGKHKNPQPETSQRRPSLFLLGAIGPTSTQRAPSEGRESDKPTQDEIERGREREKRGNGGEYQHNNNKHNPRRTAKFWRFPWNVTDSGSAGAVRLSSAQCAWSSAVRMLRPSALASCGETALATWVRGLGRGRDPGEKVLAW